MYIGFSCINEEIAIRTNMPNVTNANLPVSYFLANKSLTKNAVTSKIKGTNGIRAFPLMYRKPFNKYWPTGNAETNKIQMQRNFFEKSLLNINMQAKAKNAIAVTPIP